MTFPITVAIAAPAMFHPNPKMRIGSRITFRRFPTSVPIMAFADSPSVLTTLEQQLEISTNGPQHTTIIRYVFARFQVSALAPTNDKIGSIRISIQADMTTPTITQPHIQKEHTFFAYSVFPSPRALDMTEVPPIPNIVPIAINIKNTGVAKDTAATCRASCV